MSKSIPERWLDYKSHGDVILNTKILPFKVPLKQTVVMKLQPEEQFTTSTLMREFPKLKYIIDLTNTSRYYDPADFTNAGIEYQKVMIPGRQVPPLEYVKRFFKAIEIFSEKCGPDELIGVHCTHGINRTGYLICRYLVQQLSWELSHALKVFTEARGYAIEHESYVIDLQRVSLLTKIDVSRVNLQERTKFPSKPRIKRQAGPRPPFPPMGPPAPRGFMNGGPFPPPPPVKFRQSRVPDFGPSRPLRSMAGLPPPRGPRLFGPPRPPRDGPFRTLSLPPPMRHRPPLSPPGARPMHMPPGPMRPPPAMGPPGPPPRIPPGMSARATPLKRPITRAAGRTGVNKLKDQDFTADVFEENLAAMPSRSSRQRPYRN